MKDMMIRNESKKQSLYSILISIICGLITTSILLFGKSVLPTTDQMISCSVGMINHSPSHIAYKSITILAIFIVPIILIIFTNIRIICLVS